MLNRASHPLLEAKQGCSNAKTGVDTLYQQFVFVRQVSQQLPETGVNTVSQQLPETGVHTGVHTGEQLLSLGVSTVCLNSG